VICSGERVDYVTDPEPVEGEDGENVEVWGQMAGNIKWEFEVLGTMTNAEWGRWSLQPYASRYLFEQFQS
jgi:hypothetical protein